MAIGGELVNCFSALPNKLIPSLNPLIGPEPRVPLVVRNRGKKTELYCVIYTQLVE